MFREKCKLPLTSTTYWQSLNENISTVINGASSKFCHTIQTAFCSGIHMRLSNLFRSPIIIEKRNKTTRRTNTNKNRWRLIYFFNLSFKTEPTQIRFDRILYSNDLSSKEQNFSANRNLPYQPEVSFFMLWFNSYLLCTSHICTEECTNDEKEKRCWTIVQRQAWPTMIEISLSLPSFLSLSSLFSPLFIHSNWLTIIVIVFSFPCLRRVRFHGDI